LEEGNLILQHFLQKEVYVVEFDSHDDPTHAQNWPLKKKFVAPSIQVINSMADPNRRLYISGIAIWSSLSATFGSSIFSPAAVGVEQEFHVGTEVGTLETSLFVLGYAFGPVVCITRFILFRSSGGSSPY
jgi:DHA1 family multidrug resistance protein-like MFS transporter